MRDIEAIKTAVALKHQIETEGKIDLYTYNGFKCSNTPETASLGAVAPVHPPSGNCWEETVWEGNNEASTKPQKLKENMSSLGDLSANHSEATPCVNDNLQATDATSAASDAAATALTVTSYNEVMSAHSAKNSSSAAVGHGGLEEAIPREVEGLVMALREALTQCTRLLAQRNALRKALKAANAAAGTQGSSNTVVTADPSSMASTRDIQQTGAGNSSQWPVARQSSGYTPVTAPATSFTRHRLWLPEPPEPSNPRPRPVQQRLRRAGSWHSSAEGGTRMASWSGCSQGNDVLRVWPIRPWHQLP